MMRFLQRIRSALHRKPDDFSRSYVLNLLGFHVLRTAVFSLWQSARPKRQISREYMAYLDTLEQDGIVVIRDFFPSDVHGKLLGEYRQLIPLLTPEESRVILPHTATLSIHDSRVSDYFRRTFTESPLIREISEAYLRIKNRYPLHARLTHIHCDESETHQPMFGGTNNLHFDAPLKVLKAFYYLTDTSAQNAALRYCRGSHRRGSLSRLIFEYRLSVRFAANKRNVNHGGQYVDGKPWVKISEEEQAAQGFKESVILAKANTMVFVNTGGYHRRGEFHGEGERNTVEFNFRKIDTVSNFINTYAALMRLRR